MAATKKLSWVDRREWMEPWCFQEETFISYKADFPDQDEEIDLAVVAQSAEGTDACLEEPGQAVLQNFQGQ